MQKLHGRNYPWCSHDLGSNYPTTQTEIQNIIIQIKNYFTLKQKINYQQLRHLSQGILEVNKSVGLSFLLFKTIQQFYTRNSIRLNVLDDTMKKLVEKYVLHDEDYKPIIEKDEKGMDVYKFIDKEEETKYLVEVEKFMNITFDIEV